MTKYIVGVPEDTNDAGSEVSLDALDVNFVYTPSEQPPLEEVVLGDEATGGPIQYEDSPSFSPFATPRLLTDPDDVIITLQDPELDIKPDLDTEDWLSKLRDDEVFNSPKGPLPRLHGLRRLAKPFIQREDSRVNGMMIVPRQYVRTLENSNGEGAVMSRHEEIGTHHFPMVSVTFSVTLVDGRTFSDSADAFYSNCEELGLFPTAVASARAEARCLRKVLGISQHAAEEIADKDSGEELAPEDDSPIKPEQGKLIDKMLGALELTLKELLEGITTREIFTIEELTTGEARKALRMLNDAKKKEQRKKKS